MVRVVVIWQTFHQHLPNQQPANLPDVLESTVPAVQTDTPVPYEAGPTANIYQHHTDSVVLLQHCSSITTTTIQF